MTSTRRIEQLQIKTREELAVIIAKGFDFKLGVLVTITRAEISEDLTSVRVYVSVMPENEEEETLSVLNKHIYAVQQLYNKKMEMRPVPRIRFVLDESVREAARIEKGLYDLKNNNKDKG